MDIAHPDGPDLFVPAWGALMLHIRWPRAVQGLERQAGIGPGVRGHENRLHSVLASLSYQAES